MIKDYLEYSQYTRCLSKYTVQYYECALKRFNLFLESIGKSLEDPEKITIEDIYSFTARMNKNEMAEWTIH
jgi:site-specific recombinase XerD